MKLAAVRRAPVKPPMSGLRTRPDALVASPVRFLLHFGAVASLLCSFVQAPFLHVHAGDPHHGHARGFAHTHSTSSLPSGPVWKTDEHDSDARMIQWLAGDGSTPGNVLPALAESIEQVVLTIQTAWIPELTSHNHDPPRLLRLNPRGPPA
jgi:hypothetical protein